MIKIVKGIKHRSVIGNEKISAKNKKENMPKMHRTRKDNIINQRLFSRMDSLNTCQGRAATA